jgi:shikimate kinase
VALIGYRGTGKTSVARELARLTHWDWIDADVQIERRAGKSIAAIFSEGEEGEQAFRDLESAVLADLCGRPRVILACGGGAVLREANRQHLAACRAVIWLTASAATIEARLSKDPTTVARRPNLTNQGGRTEIEALLAQRQPIYRACATLEVDTEDKEPAAIAAEILAALGPLG